VIANHLQDHVSVRQQSQQFAGEGAMPYNVGCCEIDKHSSTRKAILDVLRQQGDLIYDRPPVSKARLLQWVDNWFDTGADEFLEDFKGDTQQRYRAVALSVPQLLSIRTIESPSLTKSVQGVKNWSKQ